MLRLVALIGFLVIAAGAVVVAVSRDSTSDSVAGPTVTQGTSTGVLTRVEDARLTLAPDLGGDPEVFGIRQVDRARLDLFHLQEHVKERWPVTVIWDDVDGRRYAVRVDDQ